MSVGWMECGEVAVLVVLSVVMTVGWMGYYTVVYLDYGSVEY